MVLFAALQRIKAPIELPCLFFVLALLIAESVTGNLMIYRTCYVILGYNESECALLGTTHPNNNTAKLEQLVQPYVTNVLTWKGLVESLLSIIPCFFFGPWSDKYGRKPVIVCTIMGLTISYVLKTVLCAITTASPWFFLVAALPKCISGGFPTIGAAVLLYITDTVPEENRPFRLGIIQAMITGAMLVGTACSTFILRATSYFVVYLISTSLLLASLLCAALLPESLAAPEKKGRLRNLFSFTLVKSPLKTIFMKRQNYDRGLLLTISVLTIILAFVVSADAGLSFLYLRQKLHWPLEQNTMFAAATQIVTIIWTIVGTYLLSKLLNIRESVLITIGLVFLSLGSLVQGFATKDWHIYVAGTLNCFGCMVSIMSRSLVSKMISVEESGKIFSLIIVCETLFALVGSPIYAYMYSSSLATFPGLFNFVSVGVFCFDIILSGFIIYMHGKHQ